MRQSQKMEAVGRLAGGVAHEFNNMLTVILGLSELLLQKPLPDSTQADMIRQIHRCGQRAAEMTRQLLAFARKQVLASVAVDLNTLVADMAKLLPRLIGEAITVVTELDPNAMPVNADAGQIEQVLVNLAANARDAMPHGGRLTIRTQAGPPADHVGPGATTILVVEDSGHGMQDHVRQRIFEPFYTTKATGKGTGLGLAVVDGIIGQSGGRINVESLPGAGTKFTICLPAAGAATRGDETVAVPPWRTTARKRSWLSKTSRKFAA